MEVRGDPDPENDRAVIVRVSGHMDAVGAMEVWEAASPHVTAERPVLLMDLSGVPWLSSAGITTLINLLKKVKALGGTVSVFGCSPTVRKVFTVVGLEPILNVCDSLEAARQRVR
jgi:anti-anti-sigma factor